MNKDIDSKDINIDYINKVVDSKIENHKALFDLQIKLVLETLKSNIKESVNGSLKELRADLKKEIKEAIDSHKQKISWGMETVRFIIVLVLFILSIKAVKI